MSEADRIERRRLYQDVVERLLERVRLGDLRPGDQMPSERALMAQYGVGRPAVREALQKLERDGIVSISHGERARVTEPTADALIKQIAAGAQHLLSVDRSHLDHLKDARVFLEEGMALRAAQNATDEGIVELDRCLQAHRHSREQLDDFLARDMDFHRQIALMTGNPIFPAIIEAMFDWLSAYYRQIVRVPGAEDITIAEHERIFRAIKNRDGEAAVEAMRAHLTRASALYRQFEVGS